MIRILLPSALALVSSGLLGLTACRSEAPASDAAKTDSKSAKTDPAAAATPEPTPEPKSEPTPPPDLAALMREHFTHASALEQAVIDGDLEAVDAHASALVDELGTGSMPDSWTPHVERIQAAAKSVVGTEDLVAAAAGAGEVVAACGACHAAVGGGPKFPSALAPVPEGEDSLSRMARHEWAARRMREGMIGPSDERWRRGAEAVSVAPPEPCPIHDAEVLSPEVLKLRERIYEIGAEAAKTEGLEARAKVYGEYLTTCAGCHVGGC